MIQHNYKAQKQSMTSWHTGTGVIKTAHLAFVDVISPKYSTSTISTVYHDVNKSYILHNFIIGTQTVQNHYCVLDFRGWHCITYVKLKGNPKN